MMSTRPTSSHIDRILAARPPLRQTLTLFVGLYIGGMIGKLVIDKQQPTNINAFQHLGSSPPGYLFDPVEIPTQCPRKKRRRVIDMTLVNSELSSLELRLNELWNVVDIFFIAESTVPFKPSAPSKPLHLTNHWDDFERFHSKMVLYVIPPEISRGTGAKVDLVDFRPNFKVQVRLSQEYNLVFFGICD